VEGKENYGNDTNLYRLGKDKFRAVWGILGVRNLGSASSLRGVAKSLSSAHPKYFFLIDRDYHISDDFIERCWKHFPYPETGNLLVW
jgi:cellulose synthase/poly-beta-1,6-N-acetylglucosamine synthase-like glycosyltransferase